MQDMGGAERLNTLDRWPVRCWRPCLAFGVSGYTGDRLHCGSDWGNQLGPLGCCRSSEVQRWPVDVYDSSLHAGRIDGDVKAVLYAPHA